MLHIIILAAGDGTRMKSRLPKVLHPVGGKPMLEHVVDTAASMKPQQIHVVFNPETPQVKNQVQHPAIQWVEQAERLGTGHAVQQAMPGVPDEASVLVMYGDAPLTPAEPLRQLVRLEDAPLAILTMKVADPFGYGRVLRTETGEVTGVVEQKDADQEQQAINEVNTGILAANAGFLRGCLGQLQNDNSQGEYYLTDVFALARSQGQSIGSCLADDPSLLEGVNDRVQLAALEQRYRRLQSERLMQQGVTLADPDRFDLRGQLQCGIDVFIDINVVIEGQVDLGDDVQIAAGCVLKDCDLAAGTRVHPNSVLEGVVTTGACDIGPFARVRPGTKLSEGSRVGNFVEVKNTHLGANSKASHLTYLGDSEIGDGVNIGAGTITCNYDGVNKHKTVIGDGAFIGSNSELVAPLKVGEGATVGAGTTLTRDAPAGQLTVSRAKQLSIRSWKRPTRKES